MIAVDRPAQATATAAALADATVPSREPLIEHRLALPRGAPVLALGAWFRNTVCAARRDEAAVSFSVGDTADADACRAHDRSAQALLGWLQAGGHAAPALVAHDLHPDFHASRHAAELAAQLGCPTLAVQHHHAHIAAVCGEHGHVGPVLGLALDGIGLGSDGTAWGGELLRVDGARCERLGHLLPLPMPGGDRAATEPWRMAAAALHALGRGDAIAHRWADQLAAAGVAGLLASGVRCPPTSSLGRVFDAAAALLGLCQVMRHEAEAPLALEAAATRFGAVAPASGGWSIDALFRLDLRPLLATLVAEADAGRGAARFHATLAAALVDWLARAAAETGIRTVAAGGGCLFNRRLAADLRAGCEAAGLHLLEARRLLPGDTAIAFGQAVVARHTLENA